MQRLPEIFFICYSLIIETYDRKCYHFSICHVKVLFKQLDTGKGKILLAIDD